MDCIPVIIVGAGPTGLTLALNLAHYGISVLVLEKRCPIDQRTPEMKSMSKALTVHARTLEHLRILGIADFFLNKGIFIRHLSIDGNKVELTPLQNQTEFPFVLSLPQPDSEQILYERCKEMGVNFQWFTKVTGIHQDDNRVSVECVVSEPTSGEEKTTTTSTIQGLYVVGCDGGHSAVRTLSNIKFEVHDLESLFLICDATLDVEGFSAKVGYLDISPGVKFQTMQLVVPHPGNLCRIVIEYPNSERNNIPEHLTFDFFNSVFKQINPERTTLPTNPQWLSFFIVRESLAERYREGRVFLAGDACHIHPPVGGMGMNTGMQDATQLAWRLAFVLLEKLVDKETFLDGYNTERRAVGEVLLKNTSNGLHMMKPIIGYAASTVTTMVPYLPESFKVSLMKVIAMLQTSYAHSSTIIETPSPSFSDFLQTPSKAVYGLMGWNLVAGDRAPHGTLSKLGDDEKQTISVYSLLGQSKNKFQLFLLVDTKFELAMEVVRDWKAFVDESIAHVTVLLKSSQLEKDVDKMFVDTDVYFDVDGRLWQHYSGWELVLVRPDSYVEFVGNLSDLETLKQHMAKIYVVRK